MFGSDREPQDDTMPTRFVRNSPQRATLGTTLKQPKLPGSERFRFNRSTENLSAPVPLTNERVSASTLPNYRRRPTSPPPPIPTTSCGHRQQQTSSSSSQSVRQSTGPPFLLRQPVYYFQQNRLNSGSSTSSSESSGRRKPIIPISKQTSRVLNNTNVELSADAIEFIKNETSRINNICKTYIVPSATNSIATTTATPGGESDVDGSDSGASTLSSSSARSSGCSLDHHARFWPPTAASDPRSPTANGRDDSSGDWRQSGGVGETVAVRNGSYMAPSPTALEPRRLSTFRPRAGVGAVLVMPQSTTTTNTTTEDDARSRSSGSLASVDNNNDGGDRNWMRIRRARNGSSTGSPSPTQSVCSSDSSNDNPWVLRTE